MTMQNTDFGIDKLTLTTPHFEVINPLNFNVEQNGKKAGDIDIKETHLCNYITGDGEQMQVSGKRLYLNTPQFNFTVKPYGDSIQAILQLNPSKLCGGLTTDAQRIDEQIRAAHNTLKQLGAMVDLQSAKVSRLDLAADGRLDYNFSEVRDLITGKTEQKRNNSRDMFDSKTFGTGKGTMQMIAYDKGKEREQSEYGKPISHSTPYVRFESRLLRGKGIKRVIGEADMYTKLLETPEIALKRAYLHVVEHHTMTPQTQIQFPDITSVVDEIRLQRKHNPRKWLEQTLITLLMAFNDADIDDLLNLMTDAIREAIMMDRTVSVKSAQRTINTRVSELHRLSQELTFRSHRLSQQSGEYKALKRKQLIDTFITPFRSAM